MAARSYFATGGLGILSGQLPHYTLIISLFVLPAIYSLITPRTLAPVEGEDDDDPGG
jgi:hypothetical protein